MGAPFHPRGTCSRLPAASESVPLGKAARGNRSIVGSGEDKLIVVQFTELRTDAGDGVVFGPSNPLKWPKMAENGRLLKRLLTANPELSSGAKTTSQLESEVHH